jgi:predicted RNA-binding Zn-ribbon protein involved in translation (DUF1610 family)
MKLNYGDWKSVRQCRQCGLVLINQTSPWCCPSCGDLRTFEQKPGRKVYSGWTGCKLIGVQVKGAEGIFSNFRLHED